MIALLRYNLKIVAPTLIWTGLIVALIVFLTVFHHFRTPDQFDLETAGSLAEQTIPVIAAFFSAGVLDWEMKRGAHELLCTKRKPLWQTVALRLLVTLLLALAIGEGMLLAFHFGIKRLPLGMLFLASVPSTMFLALVSLWTRIRLGNAFVGYLVALGAWLTTTVLQAISVAMNVPINPLFTLTAYSERLHAVNAGALDTTAYVDWWWVSKIALVLLSALLLLSISRRVEHLVEGD